MVFLVFIGLLYLPPVYESRKSAVKQRGRERKGPQKSSRNIVSETGRFRVQISLWLLWKGQSTVLALFCQQDFWEISGGPLFSRRDSRPLCFTAEKSSPKDFLSVVVVCVFFFSAPIFFSFLLLISLLFLAFLSVLAFFPKESGGSAGIKSIFCDFPCVLPKTQGKEDQTDGKNLSEFVPAICYRTNTKIISKQVHWQCIPVSLPALGKDRTTDCRAEILWELIW